jgi:acyl carrier protein
MTTLQTLQDILVRDYDLERERLAPDAVLATLNLDSLSLLELMFKIEDNFSVKITGDTPTDLVTVHDVVMYIDGLLAAAAPGTMTYQAELAKPELAKPELVKPELVKPELAEPELVKPDLGKPEWAATQ